MIHPSCSRKLAETFGEGEWEDPLFFVSDASNNTRSSSRMPQVKQKEGFHGLRMVRCPRSALCLS